MSGRDATTTVIRLAELADAAARREAATAAAAALREGELVVLPTETVYGLAVNAASAPAVESLRHARRDESGALSALPMSWHTGGEEEVRARVPLRSPAHRRLVERLMPGPVTLFIEADADELVALRRSLGVEPGVIDNGTEALVRAPQHPFTQQVIAQSGVPVIAASIATPGGPARTPDEAESALRARGVLADVALIVDDGPTRLGRASSGVRLRRDGGVTVISQGALEERYILKMLTRTVLFLCTGNTCRSPMAAAVARALLERRDHEPGPGDVPVRVRSAGIATAEGLPATPEAAEAVRALGFEMPAHTSTPLTRELISEADIIFAMTASHAAAVASIDPGAVTKVRLLDPEGLDIPDPIGQPQSVYDEAVRVIRDAVERRLPLMRGE